VRVDRHGNVWMIDEGSNMIVKFDPEGVVKMVLGRKPEAVDYLQEFIERGEKNPERNPVGIKGQFNRETDIAWDESDNIYVADGYTNSRVVKIAPDGEWLKWVGTHGSGQDQFNIAHSIAYASSKVYVADRTNNRIQVFDANGKFLAKWTNAGTPWGLAYVAKHPAIYMCDGVNNRVVKLNTDGQILGVLGGPGKAPGKFDYPHSIAVDSTGAIYVAEIKNWRVQKFVKP